MTERQIIFVLLMYFVVSKATGQSCFKRFVGGKLKSYGNCESHTKERSVVSKIQSSVLEERRQPNYCQMTQIPLMLANGTAINRSASVNSGWTVIQRRNDGSVDFGRNWTEYVNGFGDPCGNYWIGLEAIYQLTKNGNKKLRIDMIENGTGIHYWVEYSSFQIGNASTSFTLHVSGYSGNETGAFHKSTLRLWGVANTQKFSTYDVDNDRASEVHCANQHHSGWWYKACSATNLNGRYGAPIWDGIFWGEAEKPKLVMMSFSEMKVRMK